jgi:NitT/TauT family transport system permease protein
MASWERAERPTVANLGATPRRPRVRLPALRGLTTLLVVGLVWEVLTRTVVTNRLALVPLSTVGRTLVALARDGTLWHHGRVSLAEFAWGFALAAVIGIALGAAMGASPPVRDYLEPAFAALYATPIVALAPLFIAWFGIGQTSKIAVIFLYAVVPIVVNTTAGVRLVDRDLLDLARAFCANRTQTFTKVLLPAALPQVIGGLRLGVARGVVAVVVAELFGASAGLGFLILEAGQTFATATLFAAVLVLAGFGLALAEVFKIGERRLAPWREARATTAEER